MKLAGLVLALVAPPALGQYLDPTFTAPNGLYAPGQVYALGPQQADGKRVVAGNFIRVNGSAISNLVRLDADGAVDQAFSQAVGMANNIYHIYGLPSGQYLLGGYGGTVTAGGISRTELLRLNADGTADASFNPGSGSSSAGTFVKDFAVQADGKVVITGGFTRFNNVPASGVARLNSDGSVDTGFNIGTGLDLQLPTYVQGSAVAMQHDGKILVGGQFDTFNGQKVNRIVRLTTTGSVDPTFASPFVSTVVESIVVQSDGKILMSGSFVNNSGYEATFVRLLPSGASDPSFLAPGLSVNSSGEDAAMVLQPDGKILVLGGYFGSSGSRHQVTRLNADGSEDPSFQVNPGPNIRPYAIGLQANGSVLVGGSFDTFDGIESCLRRLTGTGAPDAAFAPTLQMPGTVAALVRQSDGKYIIGGNFTEINGQAVHRLARFTATGAFEPSYSNATGVLPGPATCLSLQPNGNVLVGTLGGVMRFADSGASDASFSLNYPSALMNTSSLALQPDGKVVVSGNFNFTNGLTQYSGLARFTATGALDPSFVRNVSDAMAPGAPVNTDAVLVQPDGRIVVGGRFRSQNGASSCRAVRYETTGALDATFNNASAFSPVMGISLATNRIYSLAIQPDGMLLVGGNFSAVDGTSRAGLARLTATGTLDTGFAPDAALSGTVYSVVRQPNGRVLVGGILSTAPLSNQFRVLDNGQNDASFGPSAVPNNLVRAQLVQPDGAIVLVGSFTTVSGQPAAGVARIFATNVLSVAAPAAVAARTAVWPVPAHGQLHVAPDFSAQPRTLSLLDATGRTLRTQAVADASEQTLDLERLPSGLYLLQVSYAAGTVTRRIAVQ